MYQSYPSAAGQGPLPQRPAPPQPVLTAVKLMYAGAALSVVSLIVGLTTIGSLKSAVRTANPALTAHQVNTAVDAALVILIFFGLVGIGLWIWMAWANRGGKKWARITSTVLFGIDTLALVSSIARPHSLFSLLLSALIWLAGLGAIIFLWNKESSAYFQAASAPAGY
jgi:hypothetical protein